MGWRLFVEAEPSCFIFVIKGIDIPPGVTFILCNEVMDMNINDVAALVGLSRKTLRFYESKGLFFTDRTDHSYRIYDDKLIELIRKIKILRNLGIKISDIKLWINEIIDLNELLTVRLKELKQAESLNSTQAKACAQFITELDWNWQWDQLRDSNSYSEEKEYEEEVQSRSSEIPVNIGIDIGTTTISLLVINADTILECFQVLNKSYRKKGFTWQKIQSVDYILNKVRSLLNLVENTYKKIESIGVTGQMHGILYLNEKGEAVSDLYTWQDKSGDQPYQGTTYCRHIT